jgi:DNA-binding response OmpR family regulator
MGHVLVVDDDLAVCELITIALADEGYAVSVAHSVAQALQLTQQSQPALILFDMSMSDGNGAHFVVSYRQLPDSSAMLVAVSGVANLEAEASRIGADGFLTKPFDLDDLLAIVARALPESMATDASA